MSDLEGWSRIIDRNSDQETKEMQSKPEIKSKNCSTDQIVEHFSD